MAIGQAYGILPETAQQISDDEKAFINKAVAELAENDQIIPVQLALFAEMMKDRVWSPATLKSVGGATGVGETFLEETFNSRSAVPHHRLHQKAARRVLRALLPEGTTGIKGVMRSYDELLDASEYRDRPAEFDALLRILDSELRLITPTEPEGPNSNSDRGTDTARGRYYHLTHDYLVPSLQSWLTRKQKETRQGRAELILADRDAFWKRDRSNRSLPTFFESLGIMMLASRRVKQEHREILKASRRFYGIRAISIVLAGIVIGWSVYEQINRTRATSLVESLANARSIDVPTIVERLEPYRRHANPLLMSVLQTIPPAEKLSPSSLHAAMALLPIDKKQATTVYEGLLQAPADDFAGILSVLMKSGDHEQISKQLWNELLEPADTLNSARRFRAGAALASFAPPRDTPPNENWKKGIKFLGPRLVAEIRSNLADFEYWVPLFSPAKEIFFPELNELFNSPTTSEIDRFTIATILTRQASDNPARLANLVLQSGPREYPILVAALREHPLEAKAILTSEFNSTIPANATREEMNRIEKRKAHAAAALQEFKETRETAVALTAPPDSSLSGYLEDRVGKLNRNQETLFEMLNSADTNLRAALTRSLAGMQIEGLKPGLRERLTSTIRKFFETDPDAGVHSAAEWALKSWGLQSTIDELKRTLATRDPVPDRNWYINRQGQTFVIFRGPVISRLGSPTDEKGRDSDEQQFSQTIQRDFCVCTTEVTNEQLCTLVPAHKNKLDLSRTPDSPITRVNWFRAAEYCNALSKSEDLPDSEQCFYFLNLKQPTAKIPTGEVMPSYQPEPNYLSRSGYRLLTEAEWEYACRAGTTTTYSWGTDQTLSARYAWSVSNSNGINWPVGSLCPNGFGLFDMHGNVAEWTFDKYIELQNLKPPVDIEDASKIFDKDKRPVRGSSTSETVDYLRSANRTPTEVRGTGGRIGFRVARTIRSLTNPQGTTNE